MSASAAEPTPTLVGKNEWLFYRYELADASQDTQVDKSLDLIKKFNQVLSQHGIKLMVALVPIKMRIYAEHLPDDVKVTDYLAGNYAKVLGKLKADGVYASDLNTAFLSAPQRSTDTPLFFRLDSHWTPTGAMVAAETIKTELELNAELKNMLATTPSVAYSIKVANRKRASKGRDLANQLPPNTAVFATEMVAQVNIIRTTASTTDLLSEQAQPQIAVLGSSYSKDWTGFSDSLRYVFQRDVTSVAVSADQGSWVGMESFLRDEAFQRQRPKLLIWEMPERDLKAPPDYKFREARYQMDNADWLRRVSALLASSKPAPH
ncbi:MAG: hypothetical protein FD135_4002 [Comamonadaceae bacterium]|nr:MAG: hypothetical protein FD135_4002 [Comamonadaceae bacterium]